MTFKNLRFVFENEKGERFLSINLKDCFELLSAKSHAEIKNIFIYFNNSEGKFINVPLHENSNKIIDLYFTFEKIFRKSTYISSDASNGYELVGDKIQKEIDKYRPEFSRYTPNELVLAYLMSGISPLAYIQNFYFVGAALFGTEVLEDLFEIDSEEVSKDDVELEDLFVDEPFIDESFLKDDVDFLIEDKKSGGFVN